MNRILLALLVIASASSPAIAEELHGTLYKKQSCQCCESHAKYLRENGIEVDVVAVPSFAAISEQAGVPPAFQGCHMIKLNGYVFEGHITSEIIKRFLAEKPKDVVGLSLPGMPSGAPGMEGEGTGSHKVYAINRDGTTATYATQ
jgi:hypothetical protein